jgi:ParB family transcriptional regulator, chromosome partitioning protein
MALGNKGFADQLASGGSAGRTTPRPPPRSGILSARDNRLAELASGAAVTKVHEFVDPARCRIWDGHNRDYSALNETTCADLIESMRAQGRQEVPAIVRRVTGDPQHEFEVVCGARRHWTVTWLRTNNYPQFKFLIEPRELTDEEAFRLADLENRSRKDLSDYERATDYARAIERYYGGSQQKMVERLEVSKSWLSRYLELARLPPEVIATFGSPQVIGITHAAVLAPLLRVPKTRERVLEAAATLIEEQAVGAQLKPAAVVRRLSEAAAERARGAKRPSREVAVQGPDGVVIVTGHRGPSGSIAISLPRAAARNRADVIRGVAELLDQLLGKAPLR